jgi:hypothetical protein
LKWQKYETNIGDNYHQAAVIYFNPLALKLSKHEMNEKSLAGYLKLIEQNPLDMTISYVRHTFNGLDIFYPTPYVKNIFVNHALFSLFNYVLWFLFAYFIFQLDFSKMNYVHLVALAGLLAPVFLAIPLVVEIRFFLPLYVLAYGVISFAAWNGGLFFLADTKPLPLLRLLSAGVLWVMIFFTLSAATVEQLVR